MCVRIKVESVLKGDFRSSFADFFFFAFAGQYSGPPLNLVTPGERAVFYLIRDHGVLRSTNDVYPSHSRINSGRHVEISKVGIQHSRDSIARLLLIPGSEFDQQEFISTLDADADIAKQLVGKEETVVLLSELMAQGGAIATQACFVLAGEPFKKRECLEIILSDPNAMEGNKQKARSLLNKN